MREFKSFGGAFRIPGRNCLVFHTLLDRTCQRDRLVYELNEEGFTIDDERFDAVDVEAWSVPILFEGMPIALLVQRRDFSGDDSLTAGDNGCTTWILIHPQVATGLFA